MRIDLFLDTSTDNPIITARTLRSIADALTEFPTPKQIIATLPDPAPAETHAAKQATERQPRKPKADPQPQADPIPDLAPAQEEKKAESTEKPILVEEVRAKTDPLIKAGKQKEVAEALAIFGAKTVSGVKKEDYAAFLEKINLIK